MPLPFRDRHDAGQQLAGRLAGFAQPRPIVLALPPGAVPVAYEIAHALRAPLDVFLVRHLVAAGHPGDAFGMIGSGGVRVLHHSLILQAGISADIVDAITRRERISLLARERTYRGGAEGPDLTARSIILVDDGCSPDRLLLDALALLRLHEPTATVLAVPVISAGSLESLTTAADAVVSVIAPGGSAAPERWHHEFLPISHTEVRALLFLAVAEAQSRELGAAAAG